jgi:hypothetical protein
MGQPNGNGFRDLDGNMFAATDGVGKKSLLWMSRDNGETWYDTGGRTGGRHTTFALMKDGNILGMGGKKTDIDGFMPKSISRDKGRTWQLEKTPFPALGSNQRPTLIRLKSGRLFFATDLQEKSKGKQPEGITERGSAVALSDDDGKTWHIKRLPHTLPHESRTFSKEKQEDWSYAGHPYGTIGYSIAAQAHNGVIHLITSMNHPSQHFAMNEAWILSDAGSDSNMPTEGNVRHYSMEYPDGKTRAKWSAKITEDGHYILHGNETWYFPNGKRQWEANYEDGRKIGWESFWSHEGWKKWGWYHRPNGASTWSQYWPNGVRKLKSTWKDSKCEGVSTMWDQTDIVVSQKIYEAGEVVKDYLRPAVDARKEKNY